MRHSLEDLNRRDLNFSKAQVKDVLPEYFQSEHPKLIALLEAYYEWLDSDGDNSFAHEINNILSSHDLSQTSEANLDQWWASIGNGLKSSSFFQEPRLMAKMMADFYRLKGTLTAGETFFRAFFNEKATIEYPKENIFIVGESKIGYEFRKFITDNRRYQTFSTLIKVGLSTSEYEDLYKKFVHPAGFYLEGEVLLTSEGASNITVIGNTAVDSDEIRNIRRISPILFSEVVDSATPGATIMTQIIDSDGTDLRINIDEIVDKYDQVSLAEMDSVYSSIIEIMTPNSFKFGRDSGPTFDIDLETMDNATFTRYLSDITDSAI
jgi:hypothetical protein